MNYLYLKLNRSKNIFNFMIFHNFFFQFAMNFSCFALESVSSIDWLTHLPVKCTNFFLFFFLFQKFLKRGFWKLDVSESKALPWMTENSSKNILWLFINDTSPQKSGTISVSIHCLRCTSFYSFRKFLKQNETSLRNET